MSHFVKVKTKNTELYYRLYCRVTILSNFCKKCFKCKWISSIVYYTKKFEEISNLTFKVLIMNWIKLASPLTCGVRDIKRAFEFVKCLSSTLSFRFIPNYHILSIFWKFYHGWRSVSLSITWYGEAFSLIYKRWNRYCALYGVYWNNHIPRQLFSLCSVINLLKFDYSIDVYVSKKLAY